jgi:hypothetical protein
MTINRCFHMVLAALLVAAGERLYINQMVEMPTRRNAWEISNE